ncbi:hypothetical protein HAX54_004055 [Datura stramonium]|uniref:Uncharacterized protein n=1 Tax=Datura stramonium TaxID=4076 RepID=A0ABS8WWA5_DATST|nr:hypothetical protein [Datura stramonium]
MNVVLESPLEALAFNYLTFGLFTVVNSVWTWVAIIAAGVGFWRIKASSTFPPRGDFSSHAPSPSPPTPRLVMASSSQADRLLSTQQVSSMSKESVVGATFLKGTKGKLTVYFKQDEGGEHNGDGEGRDQEGEDDAVELSKEWFENCGKLLKLRKGETGWYRYQDMKIIDGSVVRLWDGSRRRRNVEKPDFSVAVVSAW